MANLFKNKIQNFGKELLSFMKIFVIALMITIPIKYFLLEPFMVSGISMSPNYETGHYLVVNKLKKYQTINRGDVVVFVPPHERKKESWQKYTVFFDKRQKYIKRVIGLPGDTLAISHKTVSVKNKDGTWVALNEPYLLNKAIKPLTITLKDEEFFVLGDNRPFSFDSEEWGPIKRSDISGEPLVRLFPFSQTGFFPERHDFIN